MLEKIIDDDDPIAREIAKLKALAKEKEQTAPTAEAQNEE